MARWVAGRGRMRCHLREVFLEQFKHRFITFGVILIVVIKRLDPIRVLDDA